MRYWLMKSEPSTFSIDDLEADPEHTTSWEGVRNYQARNFLRDELKQGDQAFFYHSGIKTPAIVGIVTIVREGYPDDTAYDPASAYYDLASTLENPRWYRVDVRLVRRLQRAITLNELRQHQADLEDLALLHRGNRLSVLPVSAAQWAFILTLETRPI